jgi:hypothetical protein
MLQKTIQTYSSSLSSSQIIVRLCVCSALIVLVSWGHYWLTGSLKVDENYLRFPIDVLVWLITFGAIIWAGILSYATLRVGFSIANLRFLSYGLAFVSLWQLPILSNDIFGYFHYGDYAFAHQNPYTQAGMMAYVSPFKSYVSPLYKEYICPYNPLSLFIFEKIVAWGTYSVFQTIFFYKIVIGLVWVFFSELMLRMSVSNSLKAFVASSPVVWLQCLGQGHSDILVLIFCGLGICFFQKYNSILLLTFFLVLSILLKFSFVVLLAFPAFEVLKHLKSGFDFRSILMATIGFVLGLSIICIGFGLYFSSIDEVLAPLKVINQNRTSGSFITIAALVVSLTKGINFADSEAVVALSGPINLIFRIVGLGMIALSTILWLMGKLKVSAIQMAIWVIFIVICFISHRFLSWYLLVFVPLALFLEVRDSWLKWLIFVSVSASLCDSAQIFGGWPQPVIDGVFMIVTLWFFGQQIFRFVRG